MPSVSIIICTYNRQDYLRDTLQSLAQSLPPDRKDVEILVVNNASTDKTEAVVREYNASHPERLAALVREDRKGLSCARNTGMDQAKGDILCVLDDDVFVPEGWLDGIISAFSLGERVGCVAGQIRLRWPDTERPAWLDDRYSGILSEYIRGDKPFILKRGEDFFGANFALTREAATAVGGFNMDLGRKECVLLSGEDTEYAKRLWDRGFSIAYSPEGYIYHRVLPDRLSFRWVGKRYFWAGVTTYFQRQQWYYPLTSLPRLVTCCILFLAASLTGNVRRLALSSFRVMNTAGAFYAWYLHARGIKRFSAGASA